MPRHREHLRARILRSKYLIFIFLYLKIKNKPKFRFCRYCFITLILYHCHCFYFIDEYLKVCVRLPFDFCNLIFVAVECGVSVPERSVGASSYRLLWMKYKSQARFKKAELLLFLQRFEPEQLLFAKNGFIENDQNLKQNLPSIQIGSGDLKPENVTLSLHSEVQIKKIEPFLNNCACALILWPTGPHNDDMIRQFSKGPHK